MARDPAGMIDGPNLYAFVRNAPINGVDPFGEIAFFTWSISETPMTKRSPAVTTINITAKMFLRWMYSRNHNQLKISAETLKREAEKFWSGSFKTPYRTTSGARVVFNFKLEIEQVIEKASSDFADDPVFAGDFRWNRVSLLDEAPVFPRRGRVPAFVRNYSFFGLAASAIPKSSLQGTFNHEVGHLLYHRDGYVYDPNSRRTQPVSRYWARNAMSEAAYSYVRNYRNIDEIIYNGASAWRKVLGSPDSNLESLQSWLETNLGAEWPANYDLSFNDMGEGDFPYLLNDD